MALLPGCDLFIKDSFDCELTSKFSAKIKLWKFAQEIDTYLKCTSHKLSNSFIILPFTILVALHCLF